VLKKLSADALLDCFLSISDLTRTISASSKVIRSFSSATEIVERSTPTTSFDAFFALGSSSSNIAFPSNPNRTRIKHGQFAHVTVNHQDETLVQISTRKFGMPVPEHMTAISIEFAGGPEALKPIELRTPYPGEGEVLIKIAAAGVNRPDVMQRKGLYPPPPGAPETPGLEVSGIIAIAGRGTSRFKVGDEVCALVPGGGYAEYVSVAEDTCLPVPTGLSLKEAAAIPETVFTVWANVFERGGLKSGEVFLVHGGSSGIGTTAIMLAASRGAKVFATAGSAEKCAACVSLGAVRAINYMEEDFVSVLKAETEKCGADVILDMVGGDYIERNLKAAAHGGRIVNIAFLNGSQADVNFMPMLLKHLTLTASTLRSRPVKEKARLATALEKNIWPLFASGEIKPQIHAEFPLEDAAKAHEMMESSTHIGKIILVP
jgi:NADPH2:quinone reductase